MPTQLVTPMIAMVRKMLGGNSAAIVISKKKRRDRKHDLEQREMIRSIHEPKYPAIAPRITPMITAMPTATKPMESEIREP